MSEVHTWITDGAGVNPDVVRRPEYRITPRGATFDQELKTPRYALGKALNLAGGIKIGKAR